MLNNAGLFKNLLPGVLNSLASKNVFFVEIGANDGITDDPIYPFVKKNSNWSGLYVEPQKQVFEKLVKNFEGRSNLFFENIAITEKEEEVTLYIPQSSKDFNHTVFASLSPDAGSLGWFDASLTKKETVQGKPLTYLIDKYDLKNKPCVFLLIDIEGHEWNVISAIDFKSFKPSYILFEHMHMAYVAHRDINLYLINAGYKIYVGHNDTLAYLPN